MSDYQITSPSLEGVFSHDSLIYQGIKRPSLVLKFLDGPASRGLPKLEDERTLEEQRVIQGYFQDLYGVFMKKFSHFVVESEFRPDDSLTLQAMLQEMIKIKKLL